MHFKALMIVMRGLDSDLGEERRRREHKDCYTRVPGYEVIFFFGFSFAVFYCSWFRVKASCTFSSLNTMLFYICIWIRHPVDFQSCRIFQAGAFNLKFRFALASVFLREVRVYSFLEFPMSSVFKFWRVNVCFDMRLNGWRHFDFFPSVKVQSFWRSGKFFISLGQHINIAAAISR